MGKGALIAAIAAVFTTVLMLFSSQEQSNQTDNKENERRSLEIARELAMVGRKLVLTNWVQNSGGSGSSPFNGDTLDRDGGKIWIPPGDWSNPGNDTLGFTVLASYDSTVHEIRSLYAWKGFNMNTVQLKVGALQPDISNIAVLEFDGIALDDQSLQDLEEVIVDDLGLVADLSVLNLGLAESFNVLDTELRDEDHDDVADGIVLVDELQRDNYDGQDGLFYPDQVSEAVEVYGLSNPLQHRVESDASALGATFGIGDGQSMLTIEGDMTLANDLTGRGILVIEGDFVVPPGVTFNWDGVILVKPPQTSTNPMINLGGNVNINGAIMALHEGLPDTGHMDVSVMRDMTGAWSSPEGLVTGGAPNYCCQIMQHTHNFTSNFGNRVVFHSDDVADPSHENQTYFNETLALMSDSVYFEIFNSDNHGRGIIKLDEITGTPILQTAGSGFDESMAVAPGNKSRTRPLKKTELEHFDIAITRLPSLRKMWDTGSDYDDCYAATKTSGPECVWADHGRHEALTLRMYDNATNTRVWEASLYWHRRVEEEAEFDEDMAEYVTELQSPDYGLDLIIGDNTTIVGDKNALLGLGAFSEFAAGFGVTNLGTWHRQWEAGAAGNPLAEVIVTQ